MEEATIVMPTDLYDGLTAASERMDRPVDELAREAIERYLARSASFRHSGGLAPDSSAQEPNTDETIEVDRRSS